LDFIERHIFHPEITSLGLSNLVKTSSSKAELLQVEDFQ